jgi:perosamine synthetase
MTTHETAKVESELDPIVADVAERIRTVIGKDAGGIPLHIPVFGRNAAPYVLECVNTGWVSSVGKFVDQFEVDLAKFTGAKRAVAVVNGTAALHIALLLCGVEPEDEVLLPSLTFVATANAVKYCSATPHFVDVEEGTLGIDPKSLREYLSQIGETRGNQTFNRESGKPIRCLIGMHAFGHPFDLTGVVEVCREFGIKLVEDAAESIGSYYDSRHTGTFGTVGVFSFNGNKTITTGGGGAIVTNDGEIANLAKHLTTTGKVPHTHRYFHDQVAYNYRMPNLNAALGCSQLEDLPAILESKRAIAKRYMEAFDAHEHVALVTEPEKSTSNYWLNAVKVSQKVSEHLDQFIVQLQNLGIMTRPVWEPLHTLPAFNNCPKMDLATTTHLSSLLLNIPSTPDCFA